ncbi:MAG: L,D-transpeptidase family protein [Ilumatobacteraceae bacterium]
MSRSHRFLAVVLVVMLAIVGIAQLIGGSADGVQGAPSGDSVVAAAQAPVETAASTLPSSTAPAGPVPCVVPEALQLGSTGDVVLCLERWLAASGYLAAAPDSLFDAVTDAAVRELQADQLLEADGIVGRRTATVIGTWTGPTGPRQMVDADCPATPHAAIVDRANQMGALCDNGAITHRFPITTARTQPDPGDYDVYARDLNASSNLSGEYSTMTHFVAFTRGKYQGARIAFHSVPKYSDGSWVQPLESVGTQEYFGASAGCIRVLPDDAVRIWDWLSIGDLVRVIS